MKLISLVLATAGVTLVASFAALAFEGGIIADATGGIGATTPVQFAMLAGGAVAIVAAVVLYVVNRRGPRRA